MDSMENQNFDVIVVGAGHAGTEAAFAAANLGSKVLLLCTNLNCIAMMPCNPSVGGPGKGHLVREIHALGGMIASFVDATYLQMRELNESRGPAVRALRAQSDKKLYHLHVKNKVEEHPNITLVQGEVVALLHQDKNLVQGVRVITGLEFYAPSIVLATGTFLNGKIICGNSKVDGGPGNESPAIELTSSLINLGIKVHRLQTATPPRIAGHSINFDGLKELPGHDHIKTFTGQKIQEKQRSCFLTFTNSETISLIQNQIEKSPLKIGNITNKGPKHCPSIDRKVLNFPDKDIHQIFLEPESNFYDEWYLQGLTTSMPPEVQDQIVHSVKGLENAKIVRYGYAIEYDAVRATQLLKTCEHKKIRGLFTCGQINGTSGYEEAASQGFIAGVNAHRKAKGMKPFFLDTTKSYIGVMMDELVTNDREEPLRITTSSSEFRLILRNDNAEERLTPIGYELGLISQERYQSEKAKWEKVQEEVNNLQSFSVSPNKRNLEMLESLKTQKISNKCAIAELLIRPEVQYQDLKLFGYPCIEDAELIQKIEIEIKYSSFLKKLDRRVQFVRELDQLLIPPNFDYSTVQGLRPSIVERLDELQAMSVGQISKVKEIHSSELALLIHKVKDGSCEQTSL